MIISRLLILQVVLALGLGSVLLLPAKTGIGPAGIALKLPADLGMWTGSDAVVSPAELEGLAPDTGFARRLYTDPFGDQIFVSIVLSGSDMANSIHRPERCLPAQGWTVEHSTVVTIPAAGTVSDTVSGKAGFQPLELTKLSNIREARLTSSKAADSGVGGGRLVTVRQLDYYWFIGSRDVTPSTWERTYLDIRDRLVHGENQRWAYVTVAANVTDNLRPFGKTEPQTSKMVEEFIAKIVPEFQRPNG